MVVMLRLIRDARSYCTCSAQSPARRRTARIPFELSFIVASTSDTHSVLLIAAKLIAPKNDLDQPGEEIVGKKSRNNNEEKLPFSFA